MPDSDESVDDATSGPDVEPSPSADNAGVSENEAVAEIEAESEAQERRTYRKVRWWTVIAVPVILIGVVIAAWIFGDAWLSGFVKEQLRTRGMQLGPESTLSAELFGGKVELVSGELIVEGDEETRTIYRSPRTAIDVAVIDTISSGDVIIQELRMQEAVIDFRRFPDGSIPTPEPEAPPVEEGDGDDPIEQKPPGDWLEMYERARTWYDRVTRWTPAGGEDEPKQPVEKPKGWEQAKRFYPMPEPGEPATALPRLVIRDLELSGKEFRFPDGTADAALDLTEFTVTGTNVALRLAAEEEMTLAGTFTSRAAGGGSLDLDRDPDGESAFALQWSGMPLRVAATSEIAGPEIAAYRPTGTADISIDADWTNDRLTGVIVLRLIDLEVDPEADTGEEGRRIAESLTRLRKVYADLDQPFVLEWRIGITGTPNDPKLADAGAGGFAETLQKSLEDAARGKLEQLEGQAREEGEKALEGIKKDLQGDDPEGDSKRRVDELKDKAKGIELPGF